MGRTRVLIQDSCPFGVLEVLIVAHVMACSGLLAGFFTAAVLIRHVKSTDRPRKG